MATTVEKPVKEVPPVKHESETKGLQERAIICVLRMGCYHGTKVDKQMSAEVAQQKKVKGNRVKVSTVNMKDSFPPLQKIRRAITDARNTFKSLTFPWGENSHEERVVGGDNVLKLKKIMAEKEQNVVIAVNEFVPHFQKFALAQKEELGDAWKASNYPTHEELLKMFRFELRFKPIPSSDDFRITASAAQIKELKAEYEADLRADLKVPVQDLFALVCEELEELKSKASNQKSKLQGKSFGALRRSVAKLRALNAIVNDPQIVALERQLTDDLLKVDVSAAADDRQVRKDVRAKADAMLNVLKPFKTAWEQQQSV